jgi:hypothetical protein
MSRISKIEIIGNFPLALRLRVLELYISLEDDIRLSFDPQGPDFPYTPRPSDSNSTCNPQRY